ncbi:MAG: hypothetical protein WCK51_14205 [Armatimonadota bacterium]
MDVIAARWWTCMLGTLAVVGSTVAAALGPHPHTSDIWLGPDVRPVPGWVALTVVAFGFSVLVRVGVEPLIFSTKARKRGSKRQLVTVAIAVFSAIIMFAWTYGAVFAFSTALALVVITSVSADRSNSGWTRFKEVMSMVSVWIVWYASL